MTCLQVVVNLFPKNCQNNLLISAQLREHLDCIWANLVT